MNTPRLLKTLRARWWLAAVITLVTAQAAFGLSVTQTPLYQARATYIVKLDDSFENNRDALDAVDRLVRSQEIPATFVQIAESRRVHELAVAHAGLDPAAIQNVQLSAHFLPGSTILEIAVQSQDPQVAQTMANAAGNALIELTGDFFKVYQLQVLDPAVSPSAPFRPNVAQSVALGLAVGFVLGITIILLLTYLNPSTTKVDADTVKVEPEPLA